MAEETRQLLAERQQAVAEEIGRARVGHARRQAFYKRQQEQLDALTKVGSEEVCVILKA